MKAVGFVGPKPLGTFITMIKDYTEGSRMISVLDRKGIKRTYPVISEKISVSQRKVSFVNKCIFSSPDLPGWRCENGKCYLYVRDAVTWDWARQSCHSRNSTLVTISSASENKFIGSLAKSTVWNGLNDRVEAGL